LIVDGRNKKDWEKIRGIAQDFIDLTMKYKGTLSAEHGLGIAKASFIRQELGPSHEVMKVIKSSRSQQCLNPGKMGFDGKIKDVFDHSAYADLLQNLEKVKSFGKEIDNEIRRIVETPTTSSNLH
jgi:glycolate oxidase